MIKNNLIDVHKDGNGNVTDTLDIVSHSMGYAYALGIIDAINASDIKMPFGRFYIIAPEDAGAGSTIWNQFSEVMQYGSNELTDPISKQDGVAPQTSVPDIENKQINKIGGRAYIPNDGSVPRGFLSSHSIDNYGWIFSTITDPQKAGYVKPR